MENDNQTPEGNVPHAISLLAGQFVGTLCLTALTIAGCLWLSAISGISIPGPVGLAAILCAGLGYCSLLTKRTLSRK